MWTTVAERDQTQKDRLNSHKLGTCSRLCLNLFRAKKIVYLRAKSFFRRIKLAMDKIMLQLIR